MSGRSSDEQPAPHDVKCGGLGQQTYHFHPGKTSLRKEKSPRGVKLVQLQKRLQTTALEQFDQNNDNLNRVYLNF